MCQPGVHTDCDKEQHTENFLSLSFLSFFFSPLSFKETGVGMDQRKITSPQREEEKWKGGGKNMGEKKVATRPKYICTYKAVLMKAKLI